jgi:hypothetical protein
LSFSFIFSAYFLSAGVFGVTPTPTFGFSIGALSGGAGSGLGAGFGGGGGFSVSDMAIAPVVGVSQMNAKTSFILTKRRFYGNIAAGSLFSRAEPKEEND